MLLLLIACNQPTDAVWLDGFSYRWNAFNHRLSFLHMQPLDAETDGAAGAEVGVIGGASTTGLTFDDVESCISDTCREFPVQDTSAVEVSLVQSSSLRARFGSATVALTASASGGAASVKVPLAAKASSSSEVAAWIGGLEVSSDAPWPDGYTPVSCYDPRYGWLIRRLSVRVESAALDKDGTGVDVAVSAAFVGGLSLEEVRECFDAVAEQGQMDITLTIVAGAGKVEVARSSVAQSAEYGFTEGEDPPEQALPSGEAVAWTPAFTDGVYGWSSLEWTFHDLDADTKRGAYLRSLHLSLDPDAGEAWGGATNYSPGTQLSGFDWTFAGEVVGMDAEAETTRITLSEPELPAAMDESYIPILTVLE